MKYFQWFDNNDFYFYFFYIYNHVYDAIEIDKQTMFATYTTLNVDWIDARITNQIINICNSQFDNISSYESYLIIKRIFD